MLEDRFIIPEISMRKHNKKRRFHTQRPGTGLELIYGSLVGKIKGRCEKRGWLIWITSNPFKFYF